MSEDLTVTNDPEVEKFLNASPAERYAMALDDALADKLKAYLGAEAYAALRRLGERARPKRGHLAVGVPPNLVFVPGVMGSLLSSRRGGVWWVDARARNYIRELRLAPDGLHDIKEEYGITPFNIDINHMPFLAAVDERPDFNYAVFPYDWRKPLSASADALRRKVDETFEGNGRKRIHLVAHSMGGLMVRAALAEHGDDMWPKIDRIVFVGTPHYGSPAIAGYLKNHLWGFELLALLGLYLDRATFRSLWGVISLLPAPRGIYPGTRDGDRQPWAGGEDDDPYRHPCANFDLYDAREWKLDLTEDETTHLQNVLDGARRFHETLHESHAKLKQEQRDRMAVIAGVGQKTLFRLAYSKRLWGLWEGTDRVTSRVEGDPHREGDGRVTLASASLDRVGETRYVEGVHGGLPMMRAVYEDIFRWLKGDPDDPMTLPKTPGGALKGHLGGEVGGAGMSHLTPPAGANLPAGAPDFWAADVDQRELERLRSLLDAEQLPAFNHVRLL